MEYKLKRSDRRSLSVEIDACGSIIVRAPYRIAIEDIEEFIESKRERIERAVECIKKRERERKENAVDPDILRRKALDEIPKRVEHYARIMGVEPKGVRITSAQKRFGSCSYNGSLCFSYRVVKYSDDVIDYVVVHELAHLLEFNHGDGFWKIVEKYIPDYKNIRKKLRE